MTRIAIRCAAAWVQLLVATWAPAAELQVLYEDSGLRLASIDGSTPREVEQPLTVHRAICAQDGRSIFVAGRDRARTNAIYSVSLDGAGIIPLTSELASAEHLAPSPDGRSLAFVGRLRDGDPGPMVYRLDLASRSVEPLTRAIATLRQPVWSADSAHLAVLGGHRESFAFVLDVRSKALRKALRVGSPYASDLSWSPDGTRLAVAHGHAEVSIVDRVTLERTRLQLPAGLRADKIAWSPVGDTLAFLTPSGCAGDHCGEVYTIGVDGSNVRRLSNQSFFRCRCFRAPAWSPDGRWLLALAGRSKGDMDLNPFHRYIPNAVYVLSTDGTSERALPNYMSGVSAAGWCPPGGAPNVW